MKTVESAISAVLSGSITEITQRSIFNRLGPLASIETGTRGTEYFDDFVSHRRSYIGP